MPPVILHLSNDYPDAFQPAKTKAIYHLVEGTPGFRHVVYSLNRVNGWTGLRAESFGLDRTQVIYKALPKGLFWVKRLREVAAWILQDLRQKGIQPDVIQGHKFTVEGVIAQWLAKKLGCPFICSIQGDTDSNVLRRKRDARSLYRQIAQEAALVFPFAPWNMDVFERVGLDRRKCVVLPVIPGVDRLQPAPVVGKNALMTLFHLTSWKRKNIEGMARAMNALAATRPDITLDVYGGGSEADQVHILEMLKRADPDGRVTLKGVVSHQELPQIMQAYAGFILPSKTESYGMVFAEALFNGLPVLYPKNWAIDGLFPVEAIGYAADAHSVEDIAKGIAYLLDEEARLKSSIAQMQATGQLKPIQKEAILASYRAGLERVLHERAAA